MENENKEIAETNAAAPAPAPAPVQAAPEPAKAEAPNKIKGGKYGDYTGRNLSLI
jgi:hypothetical protein